MTKSINTFCSIVRQRSQENMSAMRQLAMVDEIPLSPAFSLLRQELDSMVRVIFLLSQNEVMRNRYANDLLQGKKWKIISASGKERYVLDKDLVNLAQTLEGWSKSVYKFGCAFIHLSEFHNYYNSDPFSKLDNEELHDIRAYLYQYHGYD